jgi:putative tricarboxylic transport membrane protein
MIDIFSLLVALSLGLLSGIITGLAPGIPILMGYLLFLPFVPIDPASLLIYAVVSNLGSQYFGSQAALYYRIPGETSSYPVLIEASNFDSPKKIYEAVQVTTWGSFFASVAAAFFIWAILTNGWLNGLVLNTEAKSLLFLSLLLISVFVNGQWLINFLFLALFSVLAKYEDISSVAAGILPVYYFNGMLGLIIIFAMQMIWGQSRFPETKEVSMTRKFSVRPWLGTYFRSSVIGMILGLIPQLGATISSHACYILERFRKKPPLTMIAASETSNNSAILVSWIPLLAFGVPITATEILFLQYFTQKGFDFSALSDHSLINVLIFAIVISSVIYTLLSLTMNRWMYQKISTILSSQWAGAVLVMLSLLMFYYINNYTLLFVLIHVLIFVPLSWIIYRSQVNMLSVVVGTLLTDEIISTWYRLYQIYF